MDTVNYRQNQLLLQILVENKKLSPEKADIIKQAPLEVQNLLINILLDGGNRYD